MTSRKKITVGSVVCITLMITAALWVSVPSTHERSAMKKLKWVVQNAQSLTSIVNEAPHPTYFVPQVDDNVSLSNGITEHNWEAPRLTFTQDEWAALRHKMRVSARSEHLREKVHLRLGPEQPFPEITMGGQLDAIHVWIGTDPADGQNLWLIFSVMTNMPCAMEIMLGKGA